MASEEVVEVGGDAQPGGFLSRCEEQWQRTSEHAKKYPYVWASYVVTFGGLGIYGAWRWRELRQIENRVMHYQRELLKRVQEEATAASKKQPFVVEASSPAALADSTKKRDPLKTAGRGHSIFDLDFRGATIYCVLTRPSTLQYWDHERLVLQLSPGHSLGAPTSDPQQQRCRDH